LKSSSKRCTTSWVASKWPVKKKWNLYLQVPVPVRTLMFNLFQLKIPEDIALLLCTLTSLRYSYFHFHSAWLQTKRKWHTFFPSVQWWLWYFFGNFKEQKRKIMWYILYCKYVQNCWIP
jgi:hypothetical protein